ncbi:formin homology 2 domain containing isoform X5 [Haematobia irritans]|uniref:formin homology 2 domain containing isoform X5 n=1 Tax=Haematobia irritans TaxID=7368 RepID=UPI003F502984
MIVKMDPDEMITLRIQYLVDTDPLDCTSMYPIPTRAPTYAFASTMPLATQLGTILRILNAPQRIDDAAIQVYKDGDYGAYLDLESSLAEQAEEIEGLNTSRKNSLVVRTQLSVRVHAIIEKLLSAEGSDLRRALFSLKQVFQEDKDLVHAFVALGGLNCLVRVGNGADQNYQNYILRALGQVMLYVDGMNGVMKHEPTMQWLYSLIASNYRSVVKTALKLLLVFVEYAESNCHVLVSAIHSVDKQQGTLPWSNIMRLLKDYENADAELVIYAASLINKTLGGLNDQDSFYDESDLLEQQGMESVIQHYMSKPGTDMDLINQLQLYEAVLKFEDGESDGLRLPDNTLRKTQRFRNSTDTAERRKSRRHSTGTSPGNINKVLPTNARLTPTQPALDEDSSSSTNSTEFSNGVFVDKNHRDGAGVTPGLRRRRERAERHRSFLKEQQEAAAAAVAAAAAANNYLNGLEKREEIGQLVTAIPATIKNSDSPPESLTIIPETNGSSSMQHYLHQQQPQPPMLQPSNGINGSVGGNHPTKHSFNSHGMNSTAANPINNALLINTSNGHNTSPKQTSNLLSPTKQLLGTNTISIINNSFDKSNSNKMQQHGGVNNKKNLFMERNAINGIMKNIHRNNSLEQSENLHHNGDSNLAQYRKFENNANRLNSYYSQINNSTPKNQHQPSTNHHHSSQNHQQQQSPLSPNASMSIQTSPSPTSLASLSIPPNTNQMSPAASALAAVLSPKRNLNCSSPTSAGFDFNPKTSTSSSIVLPSPVGVSAAKQLFSEISSSPQHHMQQHDVLSSNANTTSSPSSGCSVSTTALTTPQSSPGDFAPTQSSITYNTISNASMVPPPPPPPPPPPDLFGFLRPMNFYQNTNNQNTIIGFGTHSTSSATNFSNNSNTNNAINNSSNNIITDAVDYLKTSESESEDKKRLLQLKRDHTVKDLTQKLSNLPTSPTHEDKLQSRIVGDMSGLISKAKEGLAKSKSKGEVSRGPSVDQEIKKVEPKKSENELQWEELVRNMARPLQLCDLDFTDLNSDDEKDILAPRGIGRGVPPPPPPMGGAALPPPMLPAHIVLPPPMMSQSNTSNGSAGFGNSSLTNSLNSSLNGSINGDTIKKNKKTVKLFWKEVREDLIPVAVGKTIWDELPQTNVDTQKLEHLFESRAKDLMTKKQQEMNKSKEVIVLDHKRSNAINIAMTKLPPPRAIKAAILKMDATVVTREGIDKLMNMLPTEEEKGKIQEAQMANPELPLGSAEQFLLTLASISELAARLRLWAFRLDFDNSEKEIAEPLMDLKHGIEILRNNRTFKCILSTLLSVGIFLNGAPVKGFQIEYLAKVPEVKDTVHKHSLLHHLCHIVMESGMETTDLYSEIGPITRASKADFNELAYNLSQLENECKASWDRLKLMCKHDCPPQLQQKLVDFLADCAERIIILQIVHRRVMNRYRKFLLWLGVPQHSVADSRPNEFCRILSEFALEYRTTRERVQQQIEKKANHRERNKTRGKLIVDIAKFKTKEDKQDAELKELLGTPSTDSADGTLTWRRRRAENLRSPQMRQSEENFTDGDDEILESLVKTATKAPGNRTTPRERKRTRHADRKSLRRTLKNGLTEEEKLQVAALIKTY